MHQFGLFENPVLRPHVTLLLLQADIQLLRKGHGKPDHVYVCVTLLLLQVDIQLLRKGHGKPDRVCVWHCCYCRRTFNCWGKVMVSRERMQRKRQKFLWDVSGSVLATRTLC